MPYGSNCHKRFLAVLEVKQPWVNVVKSLLQLRSYAEGIQSMPNAVIPTGEDFPSYLLLGDTYAWVVLTAEVMDMAHFQHMSSEFDQGSGAAPFMYVMSELATKNWDLGHEDASQKTFFEVLSSLFFTVLYYPLRL